MFYLDTLEGLEHIPLQDPEQGIGNPDFLNRERRGRRITGDADVPYVKGAEKGGADSAVGYGHLEGVFGLTDKAVPQIGHASLRLLLERTQKSGCCDNQHGENEDLAAEMKEAVKLRTLRRSFFHAPPFFPFFHILFIIPFSFFFSVPFFFLRCAACVPA
jgi:hypothetical protein